MKTISIYLSIIALLAISAVRANAQYIDTVCGGDKGVKYFTGSRAGSVFSWTVEDGTIDSTSPDGAQIWVNWGISAGAKKLEVIETSKDGCQGDAVSALVLVLPVGTLDIFGPDAVCRGEAVRLEARGADTYLWSTGATTSTVSVKPESDTSFSVIGYFGSCGTKTSLHDLRVKFRPKADFEYNPKQPLVNQPIQFDYTGTNNVDHWDWTFKETQLPQTYSNFTNPTYTPQQPGILQVHLNVSNTFGCSDSITKYILIETGINVFIPSGFTPNNDGYNNVFIPTYENVKDVEFIVFDRWGEVVFTTHSLTEGWDGRYKGVDVPEGVFAFFVKATGFDNNNYTYKGTITVIR